MQKNSYQLAKILFLYLLFFSQSVFSAEYIREVSPGIYRGMRPKSDLIDKLAQHGIKTVINIQGGDQRVFGPLTYIFERGDAQSMIEKERRHVESKGMIFYNFPITSLRSMAPVEDEYVKTILDLVANTENHPVYLHCEHGKDRTGLIVALYRVLVEKKSARVAYQEWDDFGHGGFLAKTFTNGLDKYYKMSLAREGIEIDDSDIDFIGQLPVVCGRIL